MEFKIDAVGFTETRHEIPCHPNVVGGPPRTLPEDLELPLALGNLRIDSLMVDAGIQTQVEMLVYDFTSNVSDSGKARPCCRASLPCGGGNPSFGNSKDGRPSL